mgnify:FL=1
MNYLNLIRGTVLKMNQATFAQWKDALVGQYIVFSVIAPEEIDQEIMAEKLCDYFEKAELRVYLKTQTSYKNCTKSKNAVE